MKNLLLLSILLIVGCEEVTEPEPEDCAGVPGGDAVEDECGVCGGDGADEGYDCDGNCTAHTDCAGECGGSAVEDIDGNCYSTVQIGDQLWMAENLKVTHYNNGDSISYPSNADFGSFDEGQYGVYDNDPSNADVYGNLYNWPVTVDDRGVCPEGWHVPSDEEYTILTDYLGGESVAGGKMKETGLDHWNSPNTGATNESGFTALPAGRRNPNSGSYDSMGRYGYFWSSSEDNSSHAWSRELGYNYSNVSWGAHNKRLGFNIRCLGD